MATSGSSNWTQTRDEIITRMLRKAQAIGVSETPTPSRIAQASDVLNSIVKNIQTDGVMLWTLDWVTKTLTASNEVTGTDGEVYTCIRSHTSATTNKPITGADWSTYWVKRGSTGGVWADTTAYTSVGDFDLETDLIAVEKAFIRRDGIDYQLDLKDFQNYGDVSDKALESIPGMFYIDRGLTQHGYLFPLPQDTDMVLHYQKIRHIEDFDASANTPDFPVRWILPLIYLGAADLGEDFDLEFIQVRDLRAQGTRLMKKALKFEAPREDNEFIDPAY